MRKSLAAFLISLGLANAALAQNFTMPPPAGVMVGGFVVVATCGGQALAAGQAAFGTMDTTGALCTSGGGGGGVTEVSFNQPSNALTGAGCTVGTSSAACLGAGPRNHIMLQNVSATATIACNWTGAAVLNSNTSFQLLPGQSASWGPTTWGAPNQALNCIASVAASPLYAEQN